MLVRLVAHSEVGGNPWTSAAEIDVLGSQAIFGDGHTNRRERHAYATDADRAAADGGDFSGRVGARGVRDERSCGGRRVARLEGRRP